MSCGIPVITAANSSLIEVSGYEAKYLVDPSDVNDIYCKTIVLIKDREKYNGLVKPGYEQVAKVSWEMMGSETRKLYRLIYNNYNYFGGSRK